MTRSVVQIGQEALIFFVLYTQFPLCHFGIQLTIYEESMAQARPYLFPIFPDGTFLSIQSALF
jgi:hypothetical protein